MASSIPGFQATDAGATIAEGLDEAGCAVIHGLTSAEMIATVKAELGRFMAVAPLAETDAPDEFYPGRTRRITALMARSPGSRELALDPVVAGLCNHHLGRNCERYQLHVSAALEIGPGAREQVLHREEDPFGFFELPRPNLVIATMWAMTPFTRENGATLLVPGSHRWDAQRRAEPDEIVAAEMPQGSVLVWLGGTLHGAGANVSDEWRYGVILSYSLGWLRQEENQYFDFPEDVSRDATAEIRDLTGYPMHGSLGLFDPHLRRSLLEDG